MKKLFSSILILNLIIAISISCFGNGVEPSQSYLKAKRQAELDNLKYVLYFKADWCSPCQWMEETTFQDVKLQNAMNTDFLFVSLDIDAFEGYALKEYFKVYSLPTMLVFNANHEVVNRQEGSMSAKSLLTMVATDNPMEHHMAISEEAINTRPATQYQNATPASINTEPTSKATDLPAEVMRSITKFGVQLGAFSSYENARAIQDKASQYTTEHIEITSLKKGESTVYKVCAGRLDNESQAEQLQRSLAGYGLNGFVKSVLVGSKS